MKCLRATAVLAAGLLLAAGMTMSAQTVVKTKPGGGGSPHETVEWTIDGGKIQITYGRPYLKGRPLSQLMPPGQWYRLGADEATTIVSNKPLMFGSLMIPAGTYTLYMLPAAAGSKLIINKQNGQWGTDYDEKQDLGRVDLKTDKLPKPAEQLTIALDDTPGGGLFKVQWGDTQYSVPFMVH
jgi:hypothetical protein